MWPYGGSIAGFFIGKIEFGILDSQDDKSLKILMVISTLIWVVYSQLDSTLPQYMYSNIINGVDIYSWMLVVNAVMCVTLQIVVSRITKNIDVKIISKFSMFSLSASYILLSYFSSKIALIAAIVFMTLAEIIAMPLNELLVMQIAPRDRIGTYYGILAISVLGLGIGPMIGGYLYEYFGHRVLFMICSAVCIFIIFLYGKLVSSISHGNLI